MSKTMTIEQRILDVVEEPLGLWAVERNKRELRAIAFEVRKREDRIKRLEEAGDRMRLFCADPDDCFAWDRAKETKL